MTEEKKTKDEAKTLFEHLGLTGDNGNGIDWNKNPTLRKLKSMAIFVTMGFVIGLIFDILYNSSVATYILPLGFLLIILYKMWRDDK